MKENKTGGGFVMLQPPLDHRDYGQARLIDAEKCMWWGNNNISSPGASGVLEVHGDELTHKILSFSKKWTQKDEAGEEKEVGNFDELFGIAQNEGDGDDENSNYDDVSLHVSYFDLRCALHKGFLGFDQKEDNLSTLTKQDIIKNQRFAIDAINLLEEQLAMNNRTSISTDRERGIRVVAVSKCIGVSSSGHQGLKVGPDVKYRFAYRIRIENFNEPESEDDEKESSTTVQLLGRTWNIFEDKDEAATSDDDTDEKREVNVVAPTTGAVGHLPVIRPGCAFEYMSGCELGSLTGTMGGCFHMAIVDADTECGQVGDPIDAFNLPKENHFEMKVEPFKLIAEEV